MLSYRRLCACATRCYPGQLGTRPGRAAGLAGRPRGRLARLARQSPARRDRRGDPATGGERQVGPGRPSVQAAGQVYGWEWSYGAAESGSGFPPRPAKSTPSLSIRSTDQHELPPHSPSLGFTRMPSGSIKPCLPLGTLEVPAPRLYFCLPGCCRSARYREAINVGCPQLPCFRTSNL